jgi:PKD repeat protein
MLKTLVRVFAGALGLFAVTVVIGAAWAGAAGAQTLDFEASPPDSGDTITTQYDNVDPPRGGIEFTPANQSASPSIPAITVGDVGTAAAHSGSRVLEFAAGTDPADVTSASFDTARQLMSFYLSDPNGTNSSASFTLTGYDAANAQVAQATATVQGYASTATWVPLTLTAPGSNTSGWITRWTLTSNNDEDQNFYLDDLSFSVPQPAPPPPTADFTCTPGCTADAGTPVGFTSSTNATSPVYSWDLNGDGSFGDSTAPNPSYTFPSAGAHNVSLQVTDSTDGESTTVDHAVTVYTPPAVSPQPASSVLNTQAQLNGQVNPENAPISSCFFQWGSTVSYGNTAPCDSLPSAGGSPVSVAATIRNLTSGTVYHYRLVAQHSFGQTVASADATLTTPGAAPTTAPSTFSASVTAAPAAAGTAAKVQASTTPPPPGYLVERYQWSFLNNGIFTADSGDFAQVLHQFAAPGVHTVAVKATAVNAQGAEVVAKATGTVTVTAAANGCLTELSKGFIDLVAACIKNHAGVYSISVGTSGINLDGLELTSSKSDATLTLDTTGNADPSGKWALSANAPLEATLQNGPDGNIQLFNVDLTKQLLLPVGGATSTPNSPGMLLFSLGAGSGCQKGNRTVCAQLPGSFPLTGQVSVYLSGPFSGPRATIEANVMVRPPVNVTGSVSLSGSTATGVQLNSWSIATPSFDIGAIATIEPLKISYDRIDPSSSDVDVYMAQGGITLKLQAATDGFRVGVRFANGGFERASFGLNGPFRIGPLELTQLDGQLSLNPLQIGLNLQGQVGIYNFSAGFLYRGAFRGKPWFVQVGSLDGNSTDPNGVNPLSVSWPNPDPRLMLDGALYLYGDGFLSGQVQASFAFPDLNASSPLISAEASLGGWYAPPANSHQHATYQISGGIQAQINAGVLASLSGSVQGFLNDYYSGGQEQSTAAACGHLDGKVLGFIPIHVTGWASVDILNGNVEDGINGGCSNISQFCAPPSATGDHTVPPCLPFGDDARWRNQESAGPQQVYIPAHTATENLLLNGATGVPQVTISGPSGTYETSLSSGLDGQLPTYLSGTIPAQDQLEIALRDPKPGLYTITPAVGSPALAPILESHGLPSADVHAQVTAAGNAHTLRYSLHPLPGQKVQFAERAKDTDTLIGQPTDASHGVVRFTPQAGSVYLQRTLVALITENGLAEPAITVGHYRAPRPRPMRAPARVSVKRARDLVTASWPVVVRATAYQITVHGSDGAKRMYVTKPQHRSLRLSDVLPGVRLTISVAALGGNRDLAGPARTVISAAVRVTEPSRGKKRHVQR